MSNEYEFMLRETKKRIEAEMLKKLLEHYTISIEYLGSINDKIIGQKRYIVKYLPTNDSLFGQLPSFQNEFIMEER